MNRIKKFILLTAFLALTFVLTACNANIDPYLVGEWRWNAEGAYSYIFNADGTGERGFPESRDPFTWNVNNNRLNITRRRVRARELRNESWNYQIYGGGLVLASRQRAGAQFRYVRDIGIQYGALHGTWAWEESPSYTYRFNADGTGTRGFPGESAAFTWSADNANLFVIRETAPHDEIRGEVWTFTIENDTLIITSSQEIGLVRIYTRTS